MFLTVNRFVLPRFESSKLFTFDTNDSYHLAHINVGAIIKTVAINRIYDFAGNFNIQIKTIWQCMLDIFS